METINIIKKEIESLPQKSGLYKIFNNNTLLFKSYTGNLQKRLCFFYNNFEKEQKLEWFGNATKIEYKLNPSLFELMLECQSIAGGTMQNSFFISDSYHYLAIDLTKNPRLELCENIKDDRIYLGPFRTKFKILDIIDIFTEISNSPVSLNEKNYDEKLAGKPLTNFTIINNLNFTNFVKTHILAKSPYIERWQKQHNILLDELEFDKAAELNLKLTKLSVFYEYVKFLLASKNINLSFSYNNNNYNIVNGLLEDNIERSFRENEKLAINKADFDQAYILFQFCQKNFKNEIKLALNKAYSSLTL